MDYHQKLKGWVIDNPNNIINDCYALVEHRNERHDRHETGGGNFLIPCGLFAVLNFLADVYAKLNKQGGHYDVKFTRLIEESKTIKIQDENASFREPNEKELLDIWHDFRDTLAHFARPAGPVISFEYAELEGKPPDTRERIRTSIRPSFNKLTSKRVSLMCFVDLLIRDIENTSQWLSEDIDKYDDKVVERCLEWLDSKLPI